MADRTENRYHPDNVSPPGSTLAELLEERGMTQADLAARMGRPKKTISEVVNGLTALTPETAIQLERVLGVSAEFWNNRETQYRAHQAEQRERAQLAGHAAWVRLFPYAALARWGLLSSTREPIARARALLGYFGLASQEQWDEIWGQAIAAQCRRSPTIAAKPAPVSAWLRAGEINAARLRCAPYDAEQFRVVLEQARRLTGTLPDSFLVELPKLCAGAGVAVVFTPALPGCPISGATRWIPPGTPLIQLSVRYLTNDHLWFTFFHEAAHILLHGKKRRFLETAHGQIADDPQSMREEEEADRFAAELLLPRNAYDCVRERPPQTEGEIRGLARKSGVHPGIVVGRLQHDGLLPYSRGNRLKIRFRWKGEAEETVAG
jgi:HTH-type transcriptional regulator / antitoxin HigA